MINILLTGSTRGIGAATRVALAAAGATVIGHGSRDGPDTIGVDLSETGAGDRLWDAALERAGGRIDVLVNNAGVFESVGLDAPDADWAATWERSWRINLQAAADLSRRAVQHFGARHRAGLATDRDIAADGSRLFGASPAPRAAFAPSASRARDRAAGPDARAGERGAVSRPADGGRRDAASSPDAASGPATGGGASEVAGRIVNVASRAAFRGDSPDHWHYAAAKAGMVAMTRTIARAYAADGVLAFVVAPGFTMTGMAEDYLASRGGERLLADIPLGRVAGVAEVAETIRWLALDAPPSLTGAVLDVNGASYVR